MKTYIVLVAFAALLTSSCQSVLAGKPTHPAKPTHGVTSPAPTPAPAAVAPIVPKFAPTSFWYQAIPTDAPLNANSANYAAEFQAQMATGPVGSNIYQYTAPLFNNVPGTPMIAVVPFDCFNLGWTLPGLDTQWAAVPFPSYAAPSAGTDQEMTIYDQVHDQLYDFWQLQSTGPGAWKSCRGGRIDNVSSNGGAFTAPFGASATGLPFSAGQITVAELQAGVIRHAIGLALGRAEDWGTWSWPAQRSDGWNPNGLPNQIPEGLRARLDPSVNVDALPIHPIAKIIAKAAQTYGFVVWDKTGSTPSLRFENPTSRTALGQPDPYPALLNGTVDYALLNGFPWDKLQWLPLNYGQTVQ